jgi:hypothetical protein
MSKMNLANLSSSNIPAAKKTSESVDNPRSNTINNLQNNINKTFNYNYNYNSNDSLNKNNPLLTTNDNIQININDTDNINNTSSSYLKTSVGINSFNKISNNYNPLMTSFNLRSAFMNINNTARRGISFNDSIMMKKAGASSLKLEIDSMADLRNDKTTYYGAENLKLNNIFGRNFNVQADKNRGKSTPWGVYHTPRYGSDAGIYERRHTGRHKGGVVCGGSEQDQVSDRAVEHISPPCPPRGRAYQEHGRSAQIHDLGQTDSDRQRRISDIFAGKSAENHRRGCQIQLPR